MPTFSEIESSECRLRAEIAELRTLFAEHVEKLGVAAGTVGFSPDVPVNVMRNQIMDLMGAVPARNQRTIEAAAKWLETYWASIKEDDYPDGVPITPDSWTRFQPQAAELLAALRK